MSDPAEKDVQHDKDQQLAAWLRQIGLLEADELEQALARSQCGDQNLLHALIAAGALSFDDLRDLLLDARMPVAAMRPLAGTLPAFDASHAWSERSFDERSIDDERLRSFLLAQGRLTRQQIEDAVAEQQHTGHPLWRTLINLELLTPQDMMAILKSQGEEGRSQDPVIPEALQAARRRVAEVRTLEVDDTATAVQLANTILEGAVRARATDIHIEPQLPRMRVRYRIDGMLLDVLTVPPALQLPLVSRFKILADMDITERRLPQDGHITSQIGGQEYNLRVATMPTVVGEKLVIRLLSKSNVLTGLKQLGLEPEDEARLRSLIARSQGMILVTGPIGSGKTTTLYAALNEVNILTNNILTIEDPVEYQLAGINQVEVDPKIGLTFASGLRSILRQDADILMVGEIRDTETATVAVRAALTGQQLYSTLHTVDAPGTITTLCNFGIQPFLIASALSGVIAQRLVRRVCMACQRWYTPSPDVVQQVGLRPRPEGYRFAHGAGCEDCYHTGYLGRTGIFEILRVSDTIKHLIIDRASEQELQATAIREGMSTLYQSGVKKMLRGLTTPQEVVREVLL